MARVSFLMSGPLLGLALSLLERLTRKEIIFMRTHDLIGNIMPRVSDPIDSFEINYFKK